MDLWEERIWQLFALFVAGLGVLFGWRGVWHASAASDERKQMIQILKKLEEGKIDSL